MFLPGLVSISFRNLNPQEVITLCVKSGLKGIEWGGDVHVPHGDISTAKKVGISTRNAGLKVASYGSYYKFDNDSVSFQTILDTAIALEAPVIRVWAGKLDFKNADKSYYTRVVKEAKVAGEMCRLKGIDLAFEFHGGTLTDSNESASKFIRDIDNPSVFLYWQPPVGMKLDSCLRGIDLIKDKLKWIHVFYWGSSFNDRYPLADGVNTWLEYLKKIDSITEGERWTLLEFVKGDSQDQLLEDAKTLKEVISYYE